jgi:peptidoglycan/xylan/chitin deacetylase (PgdA/CDA1 family)
MRAVLTYHSIDESGSAISVSPAAFDAHRRWLTSGRVTVLGLDDLVAHPEVGDAVAVTFDDAFLNIAAPVERLLDAGLPVTLFVVSGNVGGTNAWGGRTQSGIPTLPLLGWADLERLASLGAVIAAHSRRHPSLTTLGAVDLDDELRGCRDDMQARLGIECAHFAYPYGDVNDLVASSAGKYYRIACTTELRVLRPDDDLVRLPRLDMYYFNPPGTIDAWGSAAFTRRLGWLRLRRAIRARVSV